MVEFAFGLVILMILLAGAVDLGRALFTYMAIREAAQEGALYGSTNPTDTTGIGERVRNSSDALQNLYADPSATMGVQVTPIGPACTGNGLQVRVSYANFPLTTPFLGTLIGSQTVPISASVTDTILSPACH
jgi:Flp pilus assembly protein TadG